MPESEQGWPKTWKDAVPYVVWVVVVLGFGSELVAALVRFEWVRAGISLFGLVAVMAAAIHWAHIRTLPTKLDGRWLVAASSAFIVALALSPFVEQRKWPFELWRLLAQQNSLSADDIAKAVVKAIGESNHASSASINSTNPEVALRPQLPVSPYVNPVHDATAKWNISRNLHFLQKNIGKTCQVIIVRYQLSFAEKYSADLKEIFSQLDWEQHESFADGTLPEDLTIQIAQGTGIPDTSSKCSNALSERLTNDQHLKNGGMHHIFVGIVPPEKATRYMKECSESCVEVDIGNAPDE